MAEIQRKAKGEVEILYIGRTSRSSAKPQRERTRPLRIGLSIAHFKATAGTLGAFVRDTTPGGRGAVMILSNSNVLSLENRGKAGDAILQPGAFDGGALPRDRVATLSRFIRLKKQGPNFFDAAVAGLDDGIEFDPGRLPGIRGKSKGVSDAPFLDEGTRVAKIGRSTGLTRGRVTAFELDNLYIQFDMGTLVFNNQIEIEGIGADPSSRGGDSGSLVIDDDRRAVGLLFAGGDVGGSNGKGLTYANPIRGMLDALNIETIRM